MRFILPFAALLAFSVSMAPTIAAAEHGGAHAASSTAAKVMGKITAVDADKKTVTITTKKTKDQESAAKTLTVTDATKITMGTEAKTFADLKADQYVSGTYEGDNALTLEIKEKKEKKPKDH